MKKLFLILGCSLAATAFAALVDEKGEAPKNTVSPGAEEESGWFGDKLWDEIVNGKVTKLAPSQQQDSPDESPKREPTLLESLLSFYQRTEVPSEGIKALPKHGLTEKDRIKHYQEHPEQLVLDAFRRIHYARVNGLDLSSLSDLFELQNQLRAAKKSPSAPDVIEMMGREETWMRFVHEPSQHQFPFPIHVVVISKDSQPPFSLRHEAHVLPTAVRWAAPVRPRRIASLSAHDVRHAGCRRITTGKFTGWYASQAFEGPHKDGHPDVDWWTEIFTKQNRQPRRVAVLVNVGKGMKEADAPDAHGPKSCVRYHMLQSLMRSRWEDISYTLLPFANGVIAMQPSEKGAHFSAWDGDDRALYRELEDWGCSAQTADKSIGFEAPKVVRQIQNQIFGGKYRYGDTVLVVTEPKEAHFAQWMTLSERSGGVQAYASSSAVLAAFDVALRSAPYVAISKK